MGHGVSRDRVVQNTLCPQPVTTVPQAVDSFDTFWEERVEIRLAY